ncbi:RagB/SusD family nutrient uptake outer membrane protein [Bizionia gelidisalsuginis]|uniref:RagB/SusD family nutrient uptake outer membrane protein n=2 Tax=Bizionia TaxID=283785 RepID=A0A8H2QFI8_9FLAO|nr:MULTISPECIES: RagB/SusD family nutrient uptake outer membrane protein [Bizionia]TYB78166.1 RagB/SusD family nutrient uptake outer membrane protein [Bizionia saleffrena]TYC12070.1 RagB/SusD family nutrient uptake outer membrane protein [Bizionia gelidisalsuginis]
MKTYIRIFKSLVCLSLFVVVSSCSIDDVKPLNKLTPDNTIRDATSAQQVLNGVYDLGREFNVNSFPLYLAAYGNEGRISGTLSGGTGFNTNEVPVSNPFLANLYNGHYKIISLSNFLIEGLEAGDAIGISETRKAEMLSEAKFQRAFAYFNLLRYFGEFYDVNSVYGVVVRTEFATDIEANPRNTVQEVYTLIVSDLEFAVTNGPTFIDHFYAGTLASKALLSKVELYRGNYDTAATLAFEVINNSEDYMLEPQYSEIFNKRFLSDEVLFAPFAGPGAEGGSNMALIKNTTYSETLKATADAQVGTATDGDLAGAGGNFDPRFSFAYSDDTHGDNDQAKYPFVANAASENNTIYHLRLGEIYLVHAEAEARRVGGDLTAALASVNEIRNRVTITPKTFVDQNTLLEDIRQEKLLELFYENGEPLFDVIRYDRLGNLDATTVKPSLVTNRFILPIPSQVIIGNNTVIQNQGY